MPTTSRTRRRVEGQAAGEREVADDTERIEIARGVDRLSGDLLRTRVVRTASDRAVARAGVGVCGAGNAEVGHDGAPRAALDENVVGLHVAMDESARMRVGQCPRGFAEHARRLVWR